MSNNNSRVPALIRSMGSPNDHEALEAAKALLRALPSEGWHFDDLARAWEAWTKAQAKPTPQKSKPFDYTKVETAVTLYAQDKTTVTMSKVIRAVTEMVAECREPQVDGGMMVCRYIAGRLRTLGFKPSKSGLSYSRG
jgi:hypothetical protein